MRSYWLTAPSQRPKLAALFWQVSAVCTAFEGRRRCLAAGCAELRPDQCSHCKTEPSFLGRLAACLGQIWATHAAHDYVSQEQIDSIQWGSDHSQSVNPVSRFQYRVAMML